MKYKIENKILEYKILISVKYCSNDYTLFVRGF